MPTVLDAVTVQNKLGHRISNVSVLYAASNKLQAEHILDVVPYLNDLRTVDIQTRENIRYTKTTGCDRINSHSQETLDGFGGSTKYRGYWQVYFRFGNRNYKIDKENAQMNIWRDDHHGTMVITILAESDGRIRIDMILPSGNAHFYVEEYTT
ncbi:unnamed protein product [Rotaria magnacalcarata]|uniref:Uncharacterized protein n=1 Tax=Rotaria magnacalcarata TaxID=392030 RepID=A0A815YP19_9BILA|nr:unnamed protein product [Rotaria magnacalcarata]CAF1649420.1 unnamed protein product [Rotaria magnacalcarata]CAF2139064.1 unnamed protein product [Rotaria magnacalcarata]CAF4559411.1 unnamed protein product [Rotaria magnacalcarata]CAF5169409.1 unnamed protein product [Rotaria magnacalcarata]